MTEDHLFVYGKLRKKQNNAYAKFLSQNSQFLSEGWINGKLFDTGDYPAAVLSNATNEKVYGEIYKLVNPGKIFHVLDDFEECSELFPEPHEYKKLIVQVTLLSGHAISAFVYIYNRDISLLGRIISGNYKDHKQLT